MSKCIETNKKIIVCGSGKSLELLPNDIDCFLIGNNDVFRYRNMDAIVVCDPVRSFVKKMEYMQMIDCPFYTNLQEEWKPFIKSEIRPYKFGERFMKGYDENRESSYNGNLIMNVGHLSTFISLVLASYSTTTIGLIGCDVTSPGHVWNTSEGRHKISFLLPQINKDFQEMNKCFRERGITVFNLSPYSAITAFTKKPVEEFLQM